MRTNLPVMLGASAIPLSRLGGMSTAYSVAGWLSLIRGHCCGACKLSQGIAALQKHGSEMLTTEATESADNQ